MSRENVELVLGLYPPPEVDFVQLYGDEVQWTAWAEPVTPLLHADFECFMYAFGSERRYAGVDGLRAFMLDWMAPWVSYRVEMEQVIDLGERVLVLNHDCGRREGSTQEVGAASASSGPSATGRSPASMHTPRAPMHSRPWGSRSRRNEARR